VWRCRLERIFVTDASCCAAVDHMNVTIEDQRMPWNSVCDIMRHINHGLVPSLQAVQTSRLSYHTANSSTGKSTCSKRLPVVRCCGDVLAD
jgi:hypothetical protein